MTSVVWNDDTDRAGCAGEQGEHMIVEIEHFFSGFSEAELEKIYQDLDHRHFPAGSEILAEGDAPHEMYVILSGTADIYISDKSNKDHLINSVGYGQTLGEMSLFTGQPVSATVLAATDLDVIVLDEADFHGIMAAYPRLNYNLGAILSARVAETNRKALQVRRGHLVHLVNRNAPPLMGYALACSVAWHSRLPTLYVRVDRNPPPEILSRLIESRTSPDFSDSGKVVSNRSTSREMRSGIAECLIVEPEGPFDAVNIEQSIRRLRDKYDHVLVEYQNEPVPNKEATTYLLVSEGEQGSGPEIERKYSIVGWCQNVRKLGPDIAGNIRIPELLEEDIEFLKGGSLPMTNSSGRGLGWPARDITKLKVGVAFGGGGFKGYAHLGVMQELQRLDIPVDYISGTSIGAAVGAAFSFGFSIEKCAEVLDFVGSNAVRLALPTASLLSSGRLRDSIQKITKNRRIEEMRTPLAIVAADIVTGREVVFQRGLIWPALLASMAIPGIYPPQKIGPYTLVDGGVLNPVPGNVVTDLGADIVVAIRLANRSPEPPIVATSTVSSGKVPLVITTLPRSLEIMQTKIVSDNVNAATVQIEPKFTDTDGWGLRNFKSGRQFIARGEAAAIAAMPRLSAMMPWLRE